MQPASLPDVPSFHSWGRLPANLRRAAMETHSFVMGFCSGPKTREIETWGSKIGVTNPNTVRDELAFSWDTFLQALNDYDGDGMFCEGMASTTIYRNDATVAEMSHKIIDYLRNKYSVTLDSEEKSKLDTDIATTFTDLKTSTNIKGWATGVWQYNRSHNHSMEVRILFSVINPDLPDWMYGLVTTIRQVQCVSHPLLQRRN